MKRFWAVLSALWLVGWPVPATAAAGLPLAQALDLGLEQSPELRQASFDLDRATVGLAGAQSERLTYSADVNVADGYGINGILSSNGVTSGQVPIANATLAARLPLFTGYRLERSIDQARAGVDAGRAGIDRARQAILWAVTEAYWQARQAELREAIALDAATKAQQARDIVIKSKAIGKAGEGETDRAEVAMLNEQGNLLRAQDERQIARDRLSNLLQRDLTGLTLEDPQPVSDSVPELADALATAYAQRPDMRLALAQFGSANSAVLMAQSDNWPQIALEGAYQHGNNPYDPAAQSRVVLDRLTGNFYGRLNLSYHLFDQGVIRRNIESRSLEAKGAEMALSSARRAAELDVKQAIARLAGARRRVELGERSLLLARKNVAYMENRFRFGYALLTELNEARQNYVATSNQRVDAAIDAALAASALARATGTLQPPQLPIHATL
jgi:outer membrane protein